ncbi:M13 family metallopeptidase [Lysobacter sp. A03]|uniref:M13 family metallopeptidase n=1 Tax=Lysobacter sp. A03 TaxID=1199154 RepID=UPI0005C6C58F|nr:M13 family metallopeptidase [Lysobacter sp. A03]
MTLRPLFCALVIGLTAGLASPSVSAQDTAEACSDFYGFANAGWLMANPLPAGADSISALGQLETRARQEQIDLLNSAMEAPQGPVQQLLGDFWASGLNEAGVEADGAQPLAPLLDRIVAIKRSKSIAPTIAALHQVGIPVAFHFGADIDLANLSRHIGYFSQGGVGLPDPAFYLRTDEPTQAVMGQYRAYIEKILALTGVKDRELAKQAQMVVDLETRLANASRPLAELRDPRSNYGAVDTASLAAQYPNLELDKFLEAQGVTTPTVSIATPARLAEVDRLIGELKPEQWRAYLRWRVGDSMAPYLAKAWRDAHFDFHGRVIAGATAPPALEQQVLDAINHAAGPMLGHEYAARYLKPETRNQAMLIAGQVRNALAESLARDTRISDQARAEASAKLAKMKIELGVPARDLDFTIQPMGRGSFGGNMLIASTWRHREEMRRIGEDNADRRWDVLPQQPALTYDLAQNRLIVTAAALQAPLLGSLAQTATLYGSFGALVGHEISHGFDSRGRHIAADTSLRDWWSPQDASTWEAMGNRVVAQYSGFDYPMLGGVKVNAMATRDENIADIAGVQLAWEAYNKAVPDADKKAREAFFEGWAGLWPQHLSAESAAQLAKHGVHAPGKWRTNGPLMNMAAFGTTYGCKAAAPMQLKADDRIVLRPEPAAEKRKK